MSATSPKIYVGNAFSFNMVSSPEGALCFKEITEEMASLVFDRAFDDQIEIVSAVGHEPTAAVFSEVLGEDIAFNRMNVQLELDDALLLGQYSGPRLPEGVTRLPPGANIKWLFVSRFSWDLFWIRAKVAADLSQRGMEGLK